MHVQFDRSASGLLSVEVVAQGAFHYKSTVSLAPLINVHFLYKLLLKFLPTNNHLQNDSDNVDRKKKVESS